MQIMQHRYQIGTNKREIDSLKRMTIERLLYNCFVICVDKRISLSNSSTNFCAKCTSYIKAFTSKFNRKLLTSIFAVPTEDNLPSTTIVFACKKPFWYK